MTEDNDDSYLARHVEPSAADLGQRIDELLEQMWDKLNLVRVYTKPKGRMPDYSAPVVLRSTACTIEDFVSTIYIHIPTLADHGPVSFYPQNYR